MIIRKLDIDTQRGYKDKLIFSFWLYLFLLIFEGALRKWFLPEFSNFFLIARDPIALYVLYIGLKYNKLRNKYCYFFIGISIFSFFTTLLFGHQNLLVALYGFRIYGIHFPAVFVWGTVLTKKDIKNIGYFTLYVMIIMTIIISIQYFSPQDTWINLGTGGNKEGSGFYGVNEYFRPSGTFSFTSGLAEFEFLCCTFLLCFISESRNINISKKVLLLFISVYLASIFFCLSRTVIASTATLFLIFILSSFFSKERFKKNFTAILIFLFIFLICFKYIGPFKIAFYNTILRFQEAAWAEGDFLHDSLWKRIFGSFIRAFTNPQNFTGMSIPTFGFGMGSGSKVGSILLDLKSLNTNSFGIAEEDWSLTVCEYGFLIGGLILIIGRTLFPLSYFIKSIFSRTYRQDYFHLFFATTFLVYSMTSQLSIPTHLGFYTVIGSITLASFNFNVTRKKT